MISNSRNKLHQTTYKDFFLALYMVFISDEFILVIGGEVGNYGDASYISDLATLISPNPAEAPVPECIRNLTNFPLEIYGGAAAVIGKTSEVISMQHYRAEKWS